MGSFNKDIEQDIKGNCFVYFLFTSSNLLLILEALAMISAGVYLWIVTSSIDVFSITFMALGCVLLFMAILGWTAKKSKCKLSTYFLMVGIIFLFQLTITLITIFKKDSIIDWLAEKSHTQETAEEIKEIAHKHYDIVFYGAIAAVSIQFLCVILSICYRHSLKKRLDDYHYMEKEYSLQEQEQDSVFSMDPERFKKQRRSNNYNY